jgi:hypothetical protein
MNSALAVAAAAGAVHGHAGKPRVYTEATAGKRNVVLATDDCTETY